MKLLLRFAVAVALLCLLAVSASAAEKITVVLDPGHGGNDPGTTVGTRYESDYNYDVAVLLKGYLEETGKFNVYMTRARDEYKKYLARALVADQVNADVLISLHFNSNTALDPTLNGVEVLASVLDEWSPDALSESICASISSATGLNNGGVIKKADTGDERGIYYWHDELGWDIPGVKTNRKSDYYSMISWGTKLGFPAIIVEHAYLSSPTDLAYCDKPGSLAKMARAEADAIIKYFTGHTHSYAESCDRRATCCLVGVYSMKCTVCGHRASVWTTPVDPSVHGWTVESLDATCTTDGYVNRECQISRNLSEKGMSGVSIHNNDEIIPAYGHSMVTVVHTEPAHAVDGVFRERCTTCGHVNEVITPGDPHVFVCIESVAATCTEDGYDRYECSVCAYTYDEVLTATGHSYDGEFPEFPCSSDGIVEYTCTVCGDVVTETIEVAPHTYEVGEETLPTADKDGRRLERCSLCGAENVVTTVALGVQSEAGSAESVPEKSPATKADSDSDEDKGGILLIIAVVAAVIAVLTAVAYVLIRGGKRRINEASREAAELLEAERASEADAEAASKPADTSADETPAREDIILDLDASEK